MKLAKLYSIFFLLGIHAFSARAEVSSSSWQLIEQLEQWNISPQARQLVESELKLTLPSLELLRSEGKVEELKEMAGDLQRRGSRPFLLRDDKRILGPSTPRTHSLRECVSHLNHLESRYQNFVGQYEDLFHKLSHPMGKLMEKVAGSLQKQESYAQVLALFASRTTEGKSIDLFEQYYKLAGSISIAVNGQLKRDFKNYERSYGVKDLRLEMNSALDLEQGSQGLSRRTTSSSPFRICGKKAESEFCFFVSEQSPEFYLSQREERDSLRSVDVYLRKYGMDCAQKIKGELVEVLASR